jgi:hypothetical protein
MGFVQGVLPARPLVATKMREFFSDLGDCDVAEIN